MTLQKTFILPMCLPFPCLVHGSWCQVSHAAVGSPALYFLTVWRFCMTYNALSVQPGTVLIMKGQEDAGRDQPLSGVIHPPPPPPPSSSKPRYDSNARRASPSTGGKGTAAPEGEFPCKKCGRSVTSHTQPLTPPIGLTLTRYTALYF